jgi:hypothetical protein
MLQKKQMLLNVAPGPHIEPPQGVLPTGAHWLLMHVLPEGQQVLPHTCPAAQHMLPFMHCWPAEQQVLPHTKLGSQHTPATHLPEQQLPEQRTYSGRSSGSKQTGQSAA